MRKGKLIKSQQNGRTPRNFNRISQLSSLVACSVQLFAPSKIQERKHRIYVQERVLNVHTTVPPFIIDYAIENRAGYPFLFHHVTQ